MPLPRRAIGWAAALALLFAQALGLAHAVAHAPAHETVQSKLARALQADCDEHAHAHEHEHAHEHDHNVFDAHHEEGSPNCLLFDQLAHADGLTDIGVATSFAAPDASFSDAPTPPRRERCGCGYHARGPPNTLA
jgi:ABC-type Zn2+ transport system substrate-binding protein/surface adhesin